MAIVDNYDRIMKFALDHQGEDTASLILKYGGRKPDFDLNIAAIQIEARRKVSSKLKSFISNPDFFFPSLLAAEQASDELLAQYHASIAGTGHRVCDMTAGLGIDAMTQAMAGNQVTAFDIDRDKYDALCHNARVMGIDNLTAIHGDSTEIIKDKRTDFDIFFIDPARRREDNSRTYSFKDCVPDVTTIYRDIMEAGARLFIKASPLLDISSIRGEFDSLAKVHAVCVRGECKETLLELSPGASSCTVKAVNLTGSGNDSMDEIPTELLGSLDFPTASAEDISPGKYLYEPNAALMKINCGAYLCNKYPGLKKISRNTNLYISDTLYNDFPGRKLSVEIIPDRRRLKAFKGERYNVAVRNYPETADNLRRRLGVKEGKDSFIYGFRAGKKETPLLVAASRL